MSEHSPKKLPLKDIAELQQRGGKSLKEKLYDAVTSGLASQTTDMTIFLNREGVVLNDAQKEEVQKHLETLDDKDDKSQNDARISSITIAAIMSSNSPNKDDLLEAELEKMGGNLSLFAARAIWGGSVHLESLQRGLMGGGGGRDESGGAAFQTYTYGDMVYQIQEKEAGVALGLTNREGAPKEMTRAEMRKRQSYGLVKLLSGGRQHTSPIVQALKSSSKFRTNLPTNAGLQFEVFGNINSTAEKMDDVVSPGKDYTQHLLSGSPKGKHLRAYASGTRTITLAEVRVDGGGDEDVDVVSKEIEIKSIEAADWLTGNGLIVFEKIDNDIAVFLDGVETTMSSLSSDDWELVRRGVKKIEPKMNIDPRDPVNIVPGELIYAMGSWDREDTGMSGFVDHLLTKLGFSENDKDSVVRFRDLFGFDFNKDAITNESLSVSGSDLTDAQKSRQMIIDEMGYEHGYAGSMAKSFLTIMNRIGFLDPFNQGDQVRRVMKLTLQRFGYDEHFDIGDLDLRDWMKNLYSEFFGRNVKYHPLFQAFAGVKRDLNEMNDWYDGETDLNKKSARVLGSVEFEGDIKGTIQRGGEEISVETSFSDEGKLKKRKEKLERKKNANYISVPEETELGVINDKLEVIAKEKKEIETVFKRWFLGKKSYRADMNDALVAQTVIETARAMALRGQSLEQIEERANNYWDKTLGSKSSWEERPEVYYARSGSEAIARILGANEYEITKTSVVSLRKTIMSLVDKFDDRKGLYEFYNSLPEEAFRGKMGALLFAEMLSWEHYDLGAHEENAEKQIRYLMDLAESIKAASSFKDELIQALDPSILNEHGLDDPGHSYTPESATGAFAQELGGWVVEMVSGKKIMLSSVIANFLQKASEKGVEFVKSQSWVGGTDSRLATRSDWLYAHRIVSEGLEYHYAREGMGVLGDTRFPLELSPQAGAEEMSDDELDRLGFDKEDVVVENWLVKWLRGKGFSVIFNNLGKPRVAGDAKDPLFGLSGVVKNDGGFGITKQKESTSDMKEVYFNPGFKYGMKSIDAFSTAVLVQMLEMSSRDQLILNIEDREWLFKQVGIKSYKKLTRSEWRTEIEEYKKEVGEE